MVAPASPILPRLVAVDPGTARSAVVVYDPLAPAAVVSADLWSNEETRVALRTDILRVHRPAVLVLEMPVASGMPASNDLFVTIRWIGRFVESWAGEVAYVHRPDVKLHVCGHRAARDPNVRAALIDRFGGEGAIGTKRMPGPLYGVAKDMWAALAVAVTYGDQLREGARRTA